MLSKLYAFKFKIKVQKQGILDILLLLNGDTKINIELQIKIIRYWDRRSLFYLSKTFAEDLLLGEKYTKLKRCVSVSILDFNLSNDPDYHRVYRQLPYCYNLSIKH
ncbi:PD-(D/E)XK nuclease family transposase [Acetatifactor muris]|uniref:PD-(D/E)XK nuclease family transposase n=1 Tax=Acetatifactor muris TaxID=879566 RepID=UPI0023F4A1E4|nr:PD-(D/E)XK nuclease family transposase [Acetatifactor muris]